MRRVVRSMGLPFYGPPADPERGERPPRVYLHVASGKGDPQHVGVLSQDAGEYVFRYADEFVRDPASRPLAAFPDKTKEYRSKTLWPFFAARIPPTDRPDVKAALEGVDLNDTILVLARVARKSIASPYFFELHS
ncbi:HipA N-terminal domain-containing protein [Myxococcota bacterium]|nr:HipA N-terminal domain-containing protein [Myxococcota bacterium]